MKKSASHYSLPSLEDLLGRSRIREPSDAPPMADFLEQIGERLRLQRAAFEWRQADVAERAGVSVQTVKAVEKGEMVSGESFFRLLTAFGHAPDLLKMLESPHFPTLHSHQRYVELKGSATPLVKRVRSKGTLPCASRNPMVKTVRSKAEAENGGANPQGGTAHLLPRVERGYGGDRMGLKTPTGPMARRLHDTTVRGGTNVTLDAKRVSSKAKTDDR